MKKLRLALILAGVCALALVSTVFGMMMAVASDLPKLENREEFRAARNSVLLDVRGRDLGVLTGPQNVVLVGSQDVAPAVRHAVIAIEDKRFYQNSGVDIRGIARALWSDVVSGSPVQGASTISQQFVKNALAAQGRRTVFEKLKEAALAYHLNRKWTKDKILTQYLNTVYFGNGAYGIESAARVYFSKAHPGCGQSKANRYCADELTPAEAAMLGAVIASPTAYDPIAHPVAARKRRDLVLSNMLSQHYLDRSEYDQARALPVPVQADLTPPQEDTKAPYFTSWVRGLVVQKFGATRAFTGGLRIRTSLDLDLQQAADQAVQAHLPAGSGLPSAAVVAIDNRTGEVRAMVGGSDYLKRPFNLATQGQRQPGSSFKPFILATALQNGISPDSVWESRKKIFTVPHTKGKEFFIVNNYEGSYSGSNTLADAMRVSDNSIYAEVGIKVGTRKVARTAQEMGIRTPVSTNYAMTLGGLKEGVTPLDMAHAYETFATGGQRVTSGEGLGASDGGPVGIAEVRDHSGKRVLARNEPRYTRVMPAGVAANVSSILNSVVTSGTGKEASIDGFAAGKTGTTENYGDAWFVGWNDTLTVAVWVGYPDGLRPMKTEYGGSPVAGGTFPAVIWHDFMTSALSIFSQRKAEQDARRAAGDTSGGSTDTTPPSDSSGSGGSSGGGGGGTTPSGGDQGGQGGGRQAPSSPAPAPAPTPAPTPAPSPPASPPSGGGNQGGGGGSGGGSGGAGAPGA